MSSNLQKLITSVRNQLAKLKPSNGLDAETLEALDDTANQVATLRAKLDYLLEVEAADLERKQAAEAAARLKKRNTVLQSVAKQTEAAVANYQALTDRASSLVGELVVVLAERERVLTRSAVGLEGSEVREVLTGEELGELLKALDFMNFGISPEQFAVTWGKAVSDACGDDNTPPARALHQRLVALTAVAPITPVGMQPRGLSGVDPSLAEVARRLVGTAPTNPPTETPRPAMAPAGQYQAVDLRS